MPSLNIEFTEEEYAQIKAAAESASVSIQPFVHDAAVDRASEHRRRVLQAAESVADWSSELNERLR
ncbi:antitoxin Phd [Gordonia sp. NPDC127522]|uniref:antitoxin Phd n=1 Tax=Gordonia sp. NPDC127522 TaxID=3345390 RepID=UPI0036266F01